MAFAALIDSQLGNQFTYVTHRYDPVSNLPPREFGYQHSAGELHTPSNGEAGTVACPGRRMCTASTETRSGAQVFLTIWDPTLPARRWAGALAHCEPIHMEEL